MVVGTGLVRDADGVRAEMLVSAEAAVRAEATEVEQLQETSGQGWTETDECP
jgi:hypothetical protein